MNRGLLVGILGLWLLSAAPAQAGINAVVKNLWSYTTAPLPCLYNLGVGALRLSVEFVKCVLINANRNPVTLNPLIP